jgi:mono/diheme cytochrome c family protein
MSRLLRSLALLAAAVLLVYAAFHHWRTKNISTVQRGWAVAQAKGCFTCHGPGGLGAAVSGQIRGMANPGYGLDEVPPFTGGLITMYAESEAEIREWILDGVTKRVRSDPEQMKLRARMAIRMPAWRGLLSERELHDLVAFVKAASDFERPQDAEADLGRQAAEKYGCFSCHGPQGRGSNPNVRAFKGYIPSWDGADFPELAANDQEIREWILDGTSQRFARSPLARFFLERQPIKMPAYRGHLQEAEIEQLLAYIKWVRHNPY